MYEAPDLTLVDNMRMRVCVWQDGMILIYMFDGWRQTILWSFNCLEWVHDLGLENFNFELSSKNEVWVVDDLHNGKQNVWVGVILNKWLY
jgi:hypothetical protein